MLSKIATILKRIFAVIQFGLLTLRYAGPRVALRKLAHQFYGRNIFIRYVVDVELPTLTPRFPCYMIQATEEDVKRFFDEIKKESNEGKYQMLVRKWYHERSFGTPYVQKTLDTDEVISIRWLVTSQDLEKADFVDKFPRLQPDECMLENVYTLERYRGKGVQGGSPLREIMINMGIKRNKGSIDESNIPAMRVRARIPGTKVFERVIQSHILFRVSNKILERYDPPVPFSDLFKK